MRNENDRASRIVSRWLASACVRTGSQSPPWLRQLRLCSVVSTLGTSYSGGWDVGMIGLEARTSRLTLSRLESRSCIAGRLEPSVVFVPFVFDTAELPWMDLDPFVACRGRSFWLVDILWVLLLPCIGGEDCHCESLGCGRERMSLLDGCGVDGV